MRMRMRGRRRDTGDAKTFWGAKEDTDMEVREEASTWHTYLCTRHTADQD